MTVDNPPNETRRRILRALPMVLVAPSLFGAACSVASESTELAPTLACDDGDDDDPSPEVTEGPYFKPSSPLRTSLVETTTTGTPLVVAGAVLTLSCNPVANALVDFWQADAAGNYDNVTFKLRGHQLTDANGLYRLETIVPGLYPGRTRHIHVKVQAPNKPVLTTQLFFPGQSQNASDGIFLQSLLVSGTTQGNGGSSSFNFVLDLP